MAVSCNLELQSVKAICSCFVAQILLSFFHVTASQFASKDPLIPISQSMSFGPVSTPTCLIGDGTEIHTTSAQITSMAIMLSSQVGT